MDGVASLVFIGEKGKGHVLLTNATESYWHDRRALNQLRRTLGALAWN